VPHLPVDVQDIGADFYVFSGHKALAPAGSGALWARADLLEAMPPFMSGGDMIESVHLRHTTFNDIPYKFEAGTPDVPAAIGLGAAVDYLTAIGMDRLAAHEEALTAYALEVLPREVPEITIHGPRDAAERAGIVTFTLPEAHAHDIATLLDREAIAIRAGHHCAQPLHERLGVAATGRASFNVYSGTDDIDRLAAGLHQVQRIFSRAPISVPETPADGGIRATLPTAPASAAGPS
jgi:cysteine desulfurase/selenocysteine lyase